MRRSGVGMVASAFGRLVASYGGSSGVGWYAGVEWCGIVGGGWLVGGVEWASVLVDGKLGWELVGVRVGV